MGLLNCNTQGQQIPLTHTDTHRHRDTLADCFPRTRVAYVFQVNLNDAILQKVVTDEAQLARGIGLVRHPDEAICKLKKKTLDLV